MNSQKVSTLVPKHGGWRGARYLVIGLALGGWLAGTAFAQQEQANASETAKPVTAMKAASKTSSKTASSPASSSPSSSSSKTASSTSSVTTMTRANENYPSSSSTSSQQPLQPPARLPAGINAGNYNMHGSVDLGWRYNNISGSQANYNTFVNLHQGPRLLDLSLNAHSLNHHGSLFDTLSLDGFGFGGDPVTVVRLNMTKNRWYDFGATYRRYKYFWAYNLLANPLNPAATDQPVTMAPHLMDLSHRMTDLHLMLLPQSSIHVRLGYAHSLEVGPAYTTTGAETGAEAEPGATALLFQNFKTTDDMYHAGFDYDALPRTTLSYDQYIQHYKEDTQAVDGNLNYQLPDGTPVDLGLVYSSAAGTPCNPTTASSGTTPPTSAVTCQANLYYDRGGRPRGTTPTERFSFQTTYFRNLNMTGQISYSSGYQLVNDLYDSWLGLNTRTDTAGSKATAASKANRIIVTGDWDAVYQITSKFHASDSVVYNSYRIPGISNFGVLNFFPQEAPGGGVSLELPPGEFTPTDCPAPYTAAACPQHGAGAGPDLATGYDSTYLGQDFKANTFELSYDFNPKVGASIGYRYSNRQITDFAASYYTAETYYPGGPTGAAAAYRGDCKLQNGVLPTDCTLQSDGAVTFTGLVEGSDKSHNLAADIDGDSALFGLWVRPTSNFRTSFNLELFSADHSFARITPRLMRHYQINSVYTPVRWAEITGAVDIVDSSDNVIQVLNKDHNRSYSLSTIFTPTNLFSFDLSYNYDDVYTQALVCFAVSGATNPAAQGVAPCPIPDSPVPDAAITSYESKSNFASAGMMVKPMKQLTFDLGYTGSFVWGTPSWFNPLTSYAVTFLDPLTPYGPLRFNYQTPYVKLDWNVYKGLEYTASWNYYGYNTRGDNNPVGLAPLGTQDFNGNNMTLAIKYAF
jgi:hypothetical protein